MSYMKLPASERWLSMETDKDMRQNLVSIAIGLKKHRMPCAQLEYAVSKKAFDGPNVKRIMNMMLHFEKWMV